MRSVLMITYFYPPLGGISPQRALYFSRDLPQFGWRPLILSVRNSPYRLRDPELTAQIPEDVPVFRAPSLEAEHPYALFRRLASRRQSVSAPSAEPGRDLAEPIRSLGERLQTWLCIPDGRLGWLPFAASLGRKVIRTQNPTVIFSTSAPFTSHLVARRLARWSGLPWVMDLRDPWLDPQFYSPPTPLHRSLNAWLEGRCVRSAHCVVCVTPRMTEEMRRRYADEPASKFVTITNGFEPADFDPDLAPDPDRLLIRHVGMLFGPRGCVPFLRGLYLAILQEPALKDLVTVELVGFTDSEQAQAIRAFTDDHDLNAQVRLRPFVPHPEAVQLMQRSQVLLLVLGEGVGLDRIYPGKLFHYLGSGRPILALAPPGVSATLIRDLDRGIVADPEDPHDVAQAILAFFSAFRQQGGLQTLSRKQVEKYERRHLAGQLAQLLDDVVLGQRA